MTTSELSSAPPSGGEAPPRTRGWVKAVLALSLAVNVAVIGLAAGAFLRFGGPPPRMERNDFGLGPLTSALTREDWQAMRPAFLERHPDLKRGPEVLRADFDPILTALRADDFDPVQLDSALATVVGRNTARLESAREVITDYLKAMDPAARKAVADRLEERLAEAPGDGPRQGRKSGKGD